MPSWPRVRALFAGCWKGVPAQIVWMYPATEEVLRNFVSQRRAHLEEHLGPLDVATHAAIVGPLFFLLLIAREPVSDETLLEMARHAEHLLKSHQEDAGER